MSKSLSLRKLKRKKHFKDTYGYLVRINLQPKGTSPYTRARNHEECGEIIHLLKESGAGKYKFTKINNGCYRDLYLEEKSDLMLVKMCYAKYLHRIYEIVIE